MDSPATFSVRDLRQRSAELLRNAEDGRFAVVTKHGRPTIFAVGYRLSDELMDGVRHRANE